MTAVGGDLLDILFSDQRLFPRMQYLCQLLRLYVIPMIQRTIQQFTGLIFRAGMKAETAQSGLRLSTAPLSFGRISYLESSNPKAANESIVMLHGAGADKGSWIRLAKHLNAGSKYNIIIPDLPGHGDSVQDLSLDYGIQQQAVRLKEFLDFLKTKRTHLMANSMGCPISLQFTRLHSSSVLSLVLMDAAGVEKTPSWLRLRISETGRNPMVEIKTLQDYQLMMQCAMKSPPYIPGFIVKYLAQQKIKRNAIDMKIVRDIEKDLNQIPILSEIKTPTLIVWGDEDKIVHVDDASLLNEMIAGSEKIVMRGTGHVPMVEQPEIVAGYCGEFLRRISSRLVT